MQRSKALFLVPLLTSLLCACGGGGGAGSPPVMLPSNNPLPPPPNPTTSPTATPTSAPTATPTGTPPASPTPTPTASMLPLTIDAPNGALNGIDNLFNPPDGDMPSGGNGQTIDGIPCIANLNENNYHVHSFLGILNNGTLVAIPDGLGMQNPAADVHGVVDVATCFYYLHTHDASGIIHVEDPTNASRMLSLHTLGQFLDIWGLSVTSTGIGPFSGPVKAYTSGAVYRGQGAGTVSPSTYTAFNGDPHTIPLYAHEVIWLEVGPTFVNPAQLPSIHFTY